MWRLLGSLAAAGRRRDAPGELPPPDSTLPALPPPHYVVEGSNELLHQVQRILAIMGTDHRRDTPEYQHLMAQYKRLGGELHAVRKLLSSSTPVAPAAPATPGHKPPGAPYTRPLGARPAGGQAPGTRPLPRPVTGASGPVRPAPPAVPSSPVPGASLAEPAPPAAPPAAAPPAAPAPHGPEPAPLHLPTAAAPQPIPSLAAAPAVEPLRLPKFHATLGPAGHPGVVHAGPEVNHLQELLTHLGYRVQSSGSFDLQTAAAVKAFQHALGIKASGVVGAEMRRLLNEMVTG